MLGVGVSKALVGFNELDGNVPSVMGGGPSNPMNIVFDTKQVSVFKSKSAHCSIYFKDAIMTNEKLSTRRQYTKI